MEMEFGPAAAMPLNNADVTSFYNVRDFTKCKGASCEGTLSVRKGFNTALGHVLTHHYHEV